MDSTAASWRVPGCHDDSAVNPQHHTGCTLCRGSDFCSACDMESCVLSVLSPAVLLDVRQGAAVPGGAVHAQSDRAPRQRVPGAGQARSLQAVPPGGLQRQDQRQHHHLAQAGWVRGLGGEVPAAMGAQCGLQWLSRARNWERLRQTPD